MRRDGCCGGRAGAWPPGRASLRVRLLAVALCLLAAGAMVITGAGGLAARGFVTGQAGRQVRAYAGRLMSRPFVATPISRLAPGAFSGGDLGGGALSIEVRGSGGQLVLRQGGGARPGHVLPAAFAGAAPRAGQLVTVAAADGGSWRVITEPVHYRARRIPFGYDAEDFSVRVTSTARPGLAGTLVVGMDTAGTGVATGGLAVDGLVVSAGVVLLTAFLGAVTLGAVLRPLARARQALAAVAAGDLSQRVPGRDSRAGAGRLAWSLNTMLSQFQAALGAHARAEAAARGSSARMCRIVADTAHALRRPVSVVHGLARSGCRGQPGPGELGQVMKRVAGEAGRMDALIDDLSH